MELSDEVTISVCSLRNTEMTATNARYIQPVQAMHVYRNVEAYSATVLYILNSCLYFCLSCRHANHIFSGPYYILNLGSIWGTLFSKVILSKNVCF